MSPIQRARIELMLKRNEAKEILRQSQQGLGNPIVSWEIKGNRFVGVGNKIIMVEGGQTFHDFLIQYTKDRFGIAWGQAESRHPEADWHPLILWLHRAQKVKEKNRDPSLPSTQVTSSPITGAIACLLSLAYGLYLLEHNVELQKRLLNRLRHRDQFWGAYYEVIVFSAFIRAGYDIEIEDESVGGIKHCEFTATHRASGKKFSVEARRIQSPKVFPERIGVLPKLWGALDKPAAYPRMVFIDFNNPTNEIDTEGKPVWTDPVIAKFEEAGNRHQSGVYAQSVYVYVTNFTAPWHLDVADYTHATALHGYKIPDILGDKPMTLRQAIESEKKHALPLELLKFIQKNQIPANFDGEYDAFAFEQRRARLLIGETYQIPDGKGGFISGELQSGTVLTESKEAACVFKMDNGQQAIIRMPISDLEIEAYRENPHVFFGVYHPSGGRAKDPLDLYHFFYNTHKNSSKEVLLKLMRDHPDYSGLQEKLQLELADIYSERMAIAIVSTRSPR